MMAEINCPMCGKPNPAELAVCQYCEARLKPLTDELSRSQPPIRPGEEPKEVDTAKLEPILPQWLRDIRQQARESSDEEAGQPPAEQEKADLLGGLQSQPGGDDEVPDWLAGLRSEGGQVGFEEKSTDEDDLTALKSMLGEDAPVSQESEASAFPGWVPDPGTTEEPAQTEPQPSASSTDFGWDADFGTDSALQSESTDDTPFDTVLPAWLQDTDKASIDEAESGLPAWLGTKEPPLSEGGDTALVDEGELPAWLQDKDKPPKDEIDTGLPAWLDTEKPTPLSEGEVTTPSGEVDLPGWLASLGAEESGETTPPQDTEQPATKSTTDWLASFSKENAEAAPQQDPESAIKSTTDWLASLEEETTGTASPQETAQPATEAEMPDWLSSLGEESPEEISPQETEESAAAGDLPAWLATLGEESSETLPPEDSQPSGGGKTPVWLPSAGEESAAEAEFSTGAEFVEPSQAGAEGEIPGWLAAMGEATAESEQPADELDSSIFGSDLPVERPGAAPVFVDDEGKPISTEDVEAIFSMDMPDWLSDTTGAAEEDATPAVAEAQEDELLPADLPSWVQAMRPVESVISETEGVSPEEQPIEQRGPLAGLRGVLPAVPGVGPSSKPKAYSIKLQASEDQQSNAAMLEKMLVEEVNPVPVTTQKVLLTQRLLRLAITILFLLVVAVVFFSGTRINPISTSVPPVVDYVKKNLPANAPVLLVFDYEAARASELEAAAAPLVDQMLTLKAPRLSLLSSTPTGSGLAERFMRILQTDREYTRNENFINLGYLSGGAAGVQAFSNNPVTTKQLTTTGEGAWDTPVLQGVSQLSNFAAIILLTDDVETARIWIEQTEGERGEARLLVVSSAQSGPMIMPYVRSGQVDEMVTGLEGSAPIEQANSERPGMVRRYWDAYGFGLLTAVVMITIGSLWSLIVGWQTRRKEQGEG
jgi:hypothetical protein